MAPKTDFYHLSDALLGLTLSQQKWVASVVNQFKLPANYKRYNNSEWLTEPVIETLGDALRIHHAFSRQALSKDRFEYAFEKALSANGIPAQLAVSRTNRGHDLTIAGVPVSLKTEASANIREDQLHITKFMELGRGEWQLPLLRDLFLEHMHSYERIFQFRCLGQGPAQYFYELVEIPKKLLQEAATATLVIQDGSRQNPKPGYGYVKDRNGNDKYALYFDGGTERKLQIKSIQKSHCILHATWEFESATL